MKKKGTLLESLTSVYSLLREMAHTNWVNWFGIMIEQNTIISLFRNCTKKNESKYFLLEKSFSFISWEIIADDQPFMMLHI